MRKRRTPGLAPALLLLAAGMLAACMPDAEQGSLSTPGREPPWQEVAARLPEIIGAFRRGSALPLAGGAQGLEIPYATAGRVIAGYVRVVANGGRERDAEAALLQHIADVTGAAAAHRTLDEQARIELPAGRQPFFRCAELAGRFGRQAVDSLLCTASQGGHLVQLRLTMAQREGRLEQAREFATAVAAALR